MRQVFESALVTSVKPGLRKFKPLVAPDSVRWLMSNVKMFSLGVLLAMLSWNDKNNLQWNSHLLLAQIEGTRIHWMTILCLNEAKWEENDG